MIFVIAEHKDNKLKPITPNFWFSRSASAAISASRSPQWFSVRESARSRRN